MCNCFGSTDNATGLFTGKPVEGRLIITSLRYKTHKKDNIYQHNYRVKNRSRQNEVKFTTIFIPVNKKISIFWETLHNQKYARLSGFVREMRNKLEVVNEYLCSLIDTFIWKLVPPQLSFIYLVSSASTSSIWNESYLLDSRT